jgi:hypothetical protein
MRVRFVVRDVSSNCGIIAVTVHVCTLRNGSLATFKKLAGGIGSIFWLQSSSSVGYIFYLVHHMGPGSCPLHEITIPYLYLHIHHLRCVFQPTLCQWGHAVPLRYLILMSMYATHVHSPGLEPHLSFTLSCTFVQNKGLVDVRFPWLYPYQTVLPSRPTEHVP